MWTVQGWCRRQNESFWTKTLNNVATFEVSHFKLKCLTKQEAVNHIRCQDEWTPANELWQDPFGSFELAIGSVSGLSGEGAVLWSLCGMVIRLWPLHSSLPMYLFPNGTDAGLRRTLLRSSETRDSWSGRLPVSSLLPETLSDPRTPNVAYCMKTFWTQPGWSCPCPRRLGPLHTTTSTKLTTSSLLQTREQTTLGWSATPAYTCHKT